MNFKLGDTLRDTITGYTGVCICVSQWLGDGTRVVLQAQGLAPNGEPIPHATFNASQCVPADPA